MIKDLIKLANALDSKGLMAEADALDSLIQKWATPEYLRNLKADWNKEIELLEGEEDSLERRIKAIDLLGEIKEDIEKEKHPKLSRDSSDPFKPSEYWDYREFLDKEIVDYIKEDILGSYDPEEAISEIAELMDKDSVHNWFSQWGGEGVVINTSLDGAIKDLTLYSSYSFPLDVINLAEDELLPAIEEEPEEIRFAVHELLTEIVTKNFTMGDLRSSLRHLTGAIKREERLIAEKRLKSEV